MVGLSRQELFQLAQRMRIKKWFMLQVWRLQQVAAIITLLLLALNLSLQLFGLISWRGEVLKNPYITVPLILLILFAIIWSSAIFWDLRLKMWRHQAAVLAERNPFAKEKLTAKEILQYSMIWIPLIERLGKEDKNLAEIAEVLKKWVRMEWDADPQLVEDVEDLLVLIGSDRLDLTGLKDKKQ